MVSIYKYKQGDHMIQEQLSYYIQYFAKRLHQLFIFY